MYICPLSLYSKSRTVSEGLIKRILVVIRIAKYCRKAVHYGISLAQSYGAELYGIHVVHDLLTFEAWNLPRPSREEDYKKEIRKSKEEGPAYKNYFTDIPGTRYLANGANILAGLDAHGKRKILLQK